MTEAELLEVIAKAASENDSDRTSK